MDPWEDSKQLQLLSQGGNCVFQYSFTDNRRKVLVLQDVDRQDLCGQPRHHGGKTKTWFNESYKNPEITKKLHWKSYPLPEDTEQEQEPGVKVDFWGIQSIVCILLAIHFSF